MDQPVASKKQLSVVFYAAKPPKARSGASRRLAKTKKHDYATVEGASTTECCFLRSETAGSKETTKLRAKRLTHTACGILRDSAYTHCRIANYVTVREKLKREVRSRCSYEL